MAGQFDFQASTSPLLAALTQVPAQQQEMRLREEQARRQRLNDLLTNMSQAGTAMRQIQAQQLQQQQAQSQMEGQKKLVGLLGSANNPVRPTPLAPSLGPDVQGPLSQGEQSSLGQTIGQTPGYQSSLQSALAQANPDAATSAIASQLYPKPPTSLEALAARAINNGQAVNPAITQTKQALASPSKTQSKNISYQGQPIVADYNPETKTYTRSGTDEILNGEDIKPLSQLSPVAEMRRQSIIKGLNETMSKKMNPANWGSSTVAGKSAALVANADSAINLADQMLSGQVPTTEQTMTSLALDSNRVLTQTGVVSEKITQELKAKTGFASLAQAFQYFSANPTDQKLQPFVKILKAEVQRQRDQRQAIVDRTLAGELSSLNQLRRLSPDDWESQINANGFDLEAAKKGKLKIRPDIGSTMYGWDIGNSSNGFGSAPAPVTKGGAVDLGNGFSYTIR